MSLYTRSTLDLGLISTVFRAACRTGTAGRLQLQVKWFLHPVVNWVDAAEILVIGGVGSATLRCSSCQRARVLPSDPTSRPKPKNFRCSALGRSCKEPDDVPKSCALPKNSKRASRAAAKTGDDGDDGGYYEVEASLGHFFKDGAANFQIFGVVGAILSLCFSAPHRPLPRTPPPPTTTPTHPPPPPLRHRDSPPLARRDTSSLVALAR